MDPSSLLLPKVRVDGWTPARRARFLAVLEQCALVSIACRACGLSRQAAYTLRRRDAAFARAWDAALVRHEIRRDEAFRAEVADLLARAARSGRPSGKFPQDTVNSSTSRQLAGS